MNYDLYRKSQSTIDLHYTRKRVLFSSADGFFYWNILRSKADIIINIDEDAFITDNQALKDLIEFTIDNKIINCGMPDGGVVDIRKHNPLVTNPFFNILNIPEIKKKFDLRSIIKNYNCHDKKFEKFTPKHLLRTEYKYDFYEPYVPFFLWLTNNFKTLFLDAQVHPDGISTILKNHKNEPFLNHSWYSRFYGIDKFHTNRINNLYKESRQNDLVEQKFRIKCKKIFESKGNKYYYPYKLKFEKRFMNKFYNYV